MATIEQLAQQNVLRKHEADLEHWEMPDRCIYLTEVFECWFDAVLKPHPKFRDRNVSPWDQVEQLFYEFVSGKPMAYDVHLKKLEPLTQFIWEFKMPDVRVFGWFAKKGHFVATFGEFKNNLATRKLYKPFIDHAIWIRDQLPLDPPKHIVQTRMIDVL
jgi:hypothetical protein